jgi:hypothetical protein
VIADLRGALDPAVEEAADDALMDELVATLSLPLAASWAMRAEVPVPQGLRSMAFSP